MWESQTNSAWNVRCVFKMMHLILKSTSQEDPVQDGSLPGELRSSFPCEGAALLFLPPLTETPAGVHLTASDHVI